MANKHKRDTRYVYGVGCAWSGSIHEVKVNTVGLPCCPHCFGLLMEVPNEEGWWRSAQKWEDEGHPNYVDMLKWAKGKHFLKMSDMKTAYEARVIQS